MQVLFLNYTFFMAKVNDEIDDMALASWDHLNSLKGQLSN